MDDVRETDLLAELWHVHDPRLNGNVLFNDYKQQLPSHSQTRDVC